MIKINAKIDTRQLERYFANLGKQIPYAMARTINKLSFDDARPAMKAEIKSKVDRPTSNTLNAVKVRPASKSKLESLIYIRDEASKGVSPAEYLSPISGNGRVSIKRSEKALMRRGILGSNQRLIPGRRSKLNRNGNWSGAQMNKALSNIGAQHDRYQNTNRQTKKKRGQNRYDYFLIRNDHPSLVPGIWKEEKGWAYPWVIFADKASKRKQVIDLEKAAIQAIKVNFHKRARETVLHLKASASI